MKTKTALGRVVAGVGAVALGFAGLLGGATIANAAPGPDQPNHPEVGSLTIHKYVGDQGAAGDGTLQENVNGTPLDGAEFTIWQLGKMDEGVCKALNLGTYDDWEGVPTGPAPKTLDAVKAAGFCVVNEEGTAQTTGNGGVTTFTNLGLGLYYVQETDAPANIVSKSAPFYVSIPLPHETENWIYDVHAYPKNQEAENPVKTINTDEEQPDKGLSVGKEVEWTITQTVPKLNDGEAYESASVWDFLPATLEYVADSYEISLSGDQPLEVGDYTFTQDGQSLTWKLEENGLKKLAADKIITVKFSTKVLEVTEDGAIANEPSAEPSPEKPGYGSEFNGNKLPGKTTPMTYWGQLQVKKVDQDKAALAGAEFQVFNNFADGACPAELPGGDPVAKGTSDADGVVQWDDVNPANPLGLWIANSQDGPITPTPSKTYCLYETKVPAGYTADQKGAPVEITPGTTLTKDVNDLTVENTKREGPELPLTGAGGTLLLSVIGVGLAAAGVTLAAVSRRKRQA